MATFKVGQRVKRVMDPRMNNGLSGAVPLGSTGTILGPDLKAIEKDSWCVKWDGLSVPPNGWFGWSLAPLTDPGADAFLESIRKMKPYEEPKVERDPLFVITTIPR